MGRLGVLMTIGSVSEGRKLLPLVRDMFRNRELFIHDGAVMRRIHVSARAQMAGAILGVFVALGAVLSLGQLALSAVGFSQSAVAFASRQSDIMAIERKVAALQGEVAAAKKAAREHATVLEARHAALASLLKGQADANTLAAMVPALEEHDDGAAQDVALAFSNVEQQQAAMARAIRAATDARYAQAAGMVSRLGINPASMGGMGGPYEPVTDDAADTPKKADPQFRALFDSWKRLDTLQASLISVPSQKPVDMVTLTSGFGVRSDPFRGGRAMHAGVDIPGPIGTPIYATADAIVGRTGWVGGYGNMIELEHGKGIQTRYGHLSSVGVVPGQRIKRGQQIGLMGSTGRSTGSHLHYEVRLDGRAVNPIPFLRTADYLLAMQQRAGSAVAMGGPEDGAKAVAAAK